MKEIHVTQENTDAARVEPIVSLTFDHAVQIARGCIDYGGGYRSDPVALNIYHHGVVTVVRALEAAQKSGLVDAQVKVLHMIGGSN